MSLHPFITAMLEQLAGLPALSAGSPEDARAMVAAGRARLGPGPEMAQVTALTLSGRAGAIPARLLVPPGDSAGTIVYLHGGGWVVGALDDYDIYTRSLASRTGMAVLAVDYRLAPEHPFPAGLDDAADALDAVLAGKVPGLPAGPVVVMGDSAGGNLATVCCARLADPAAVCLQVLYYPVTDCDFSRGSYDAHGEGLPLTAADMRWFFGHYAPVATWADPAISPLRGPLPRVPAVVVTAEYDVLADEGAAYADALAAAGVPVRHRRVPGVTHGFIRLHNLFDVADAELTAIATDIRAAVAGADNTSQGA